MQAALSKTWMDLSHALFDPVDGLFAKTYPTRDEREKFVGTEEYKAIRQLLDDAEKLFLDWTAPDLPPAPCNNQLWNEAKPVPFQCERCAGLPRCELGVVRELNPGARR